MNTLSGRTGAGCAEVLSPEELDALKAAAAKAQEANLRWTKRTTENARVFYKHHVENTPTATPLSSAACSVRHVAD